MFRQARNASLGIISILVILLIGIHQGYAVQSIPQKNVCILQPIDQGVSPNAVQTAYTVLQRYNVNTTYIGLVQELTDKSNKGCDIVVQFAMMNNNYNTGFYNINNNFVPYDIHGNIITIYTSNIPVTPNTEQGGSVTILMTNPICMSEALATYHQVLTGFSGHTTCNPYDGLGEGPSGSSPYVPVYKIEQALNQALKASGL